MPDPDPAPVVPLLFNITIAAELLGLEVKTLRRELASGRLPCARVGVGSRTIRFNQAHLAEYRRRATNTDGVLIPDPRSWPP
ncbi:helix-turn-helix domain-containing protein [Tessaracoccus sp.]